VKMRRPIQVPVASWSTADLVRRLSRVLDVATQAIERLATNGYADSQDRSNTLRCEKLISETAFLLLRASKVQEHPEVRQRVIGLAARLLPHARSERMLLGVCVEPAVALDYAQAHIYLTRLGYPDAAFDEVLRQSLTSQVRSGRERPPHRVLEQEWLTRTWDGVRSSSRRSSSLAARHSMLGRPMDLLSGSRGDVYAFTHAVLYVTDINLMPQRLPRPASDILAEAEAALGRCLDDEDYDLGGEVLLAWPLLGKAWSAAAAFGFRVVADVEDRAGFLPSPSTRLQRLHELSGDERAEYLLATAYHTIYVMGLLCAAALQPGNAPPVRLPGARFPAGSSGPILQFLDADRRSGHWREEVERLTASERDAIAGLLFSVALRRKASERDFVGLRELLATGYRLGLAECPAASQAAELLDRVAAAAPMLLEARRQSQASLNSGRVGSEGRESPSADNGPAPLAGPSEDRTEHQPAAEGPVLAN